MYIYIALIALISQLSVQNYYLKKDKEILNSQVQLYVQQLYLLEKSSKIHEENVLSASAIAAANMEKRSIEAGEILRQDVSKDCENAMKWGVEQAKTI